MAAHRRMRIGVKAAFCRDGRWPRTTAGRGGRAASVHGGEPEAGASWQKAQDCRFADVGSRLRRRKRGGVPSPSLLEEPAGPTRGPAQVERWRLFRCPMASIPGLPLCGPGPRLRRRKRGTAQPPSLLRTSTGPALCGWCGLGSGTGAAASWRAVWGAAVLTRALVCAGANEAAESGKRPKPAHQGCTLACSLLGDRLVTVRPQPEKVEKQRWTIPFSTRLRRRKRHGTRAQRGCARSWACALVQRVRCGGLLLDAARGAKRRSGFPTVCAGANGAGTARPAPPVGATPAWTFQAEATPSTGEGAARAQPPSRVTRGSARVAQA